MRTAPPRPVAVFCMPEEGHLRRLLPLVRRLAARGVPTHVYTDARFGGLVAAAGGVPEDLFGPWPLAAADSESRPVPCRYVSFAGHYAEPVLAALARLRPGLVIYDTFAVIGRLVAHVLGVPGVNVCAGHNVAPARFLAELATDPRVAVAPACQQAVAVLAGYGLPWASPFAYVAGLSPHLNIYCEPREFLTPDQARVFEPVAWFGSLPDPADMAGREREAGPAAFAGNGRQRLYICFGTVVWRYYATAALAALDALATACARRPDVDALISLGGHPLDAGARAALERPNVRVATRVNQWQVLREADAFVTHHGLNSTHEAIWHQVPMVSYPFFWDQPDLAVRCQALGLAVPLARSPRGPVTADAATAALAAALPPPPAMAARMAEARERELAVMAGRDGVVATVVGLMG